MVLRPIQKRFLPDTITVFNESRADAKNMVITVIKHVNFADSNSYNFRQTGTFTAESFRVVVDMVNSEAARPFMRHAEWLAAADDSHYTLYSGMWLFEGEHADYADGALVLAKDINVKAFQGKGLRLLKAKSCDLNGLNGIHHVALAG